MPDVMLNAAAGGQKPQTPAVVFCQDGARLHYAIPIALRRAGMLAGLYTEWYRDGSRRANLALAVLRLLSPENARRFNLRHAPELDGAPIFSLRLTGPLFIIAARRANKFFRAVHQTWWQAAAARGPLGRPQGKDAVCFGFLFSMLPAAYTNRIRARGFRIVIDMPIAAMAEAVRQQRAAIDRWPGWELIDDAPAQAKGDPDVQEIDKITDHWTCASEYVRQSLVEVGITQEKISVIPYPVDVRDFDLVDRVGRHGPVLVGFVGQVGLRKGAPWFLETAKRLKGTAARFVMVGPVALTDIGRKQMATAVELIGAVPRSEVRGWLEKFDILLFPSTCEGSAGAVMEAMSTGLPVVSTPNSGTIVRDGVDGFIRPYDQPDELAACVEKLIMDQALRLEMGRSARQQVEANDIDAYSRKISELMRCVVGVESSSSVGE